MKTVIFDLGNVLLDWKPQALFRKYFEDEQSVENFLNEIDFWAVNARADAGRWRDAEAELVARFPQYREIIEAYIPNFLDSVVGEIEGTAGIIVDLTDRGVPVYGLTNWASDTFERAYLAFPILREGFLDILVSGEHGLIKPDRRIFELALERWNLDAADAIFIDDSVKNVEGARAVGIDAIHFTDAGALRGALSERHLLK